MIKIGIEVEFFLTQNNQLINVAKAGLPSDGYPLLAEARGNPSDCVFQAVSSARGEMERISCLAIQKGYVPLYDNWVKKEAYIEKLDEFILREGMRKQINWRNLYGKKSSVKNKKYISAGLHVSFTDSQHVKYVDQDKQTRVISYNAVFDYPNLFNNITQEFINEIKTAERVEGFYEVKNDGRVEYRSLPATIIQSPDFAARLNKCVRKSVNV